MIASFNKSFIVTVQVSLGVKDREAHFHGHLVRFLSPIWKMHKLHHINHVRTWAHLELEQFEDSVTKKSNYVRHKTLLMKHGIKRYCCGSCCWNSKWWWFCTSVEIYEPFAIHVFPLRLWRRTLVIPGHQAILWRGFNRLIIHTHCSG